MLKKILSNSFIYGLAPQLIGIINMLMLPILTPHLSTVDYGVYGVVNAILSGLTLFQFLGMTVVASNAYYNNTNKFIDTWRKVLGILMLWNIPFILCQAIILFFIIPKDVNDHLMSIIYLTSLPVLLNSTLTHLGSLYLQLKMEPKPIFWRTFVIGLLVVILNYYLIVALEMGFMSWFYSNCLGSCLMGISYFSVFRKLKLYPTFKAFNKLKNIISLGLSTIPHHFSSFVLASSDRLIMDRMGVSINEIGRYNLSNSIGGKIFQISNGLGTAISPLVIRLYKKNEYKKIQNLIQILFEIILIATFILSIWTKEIFQFLIRNDEMKDVYPIAIFLIMSINYKPYFILSSVLMEFKERTSQLSKLSISIMIFNIILNVAFILKWGIIGAGISTFISYITYGFVSFFLPSFGLHQFDKRKILITLFSCLIIATATFYVVTLAVSYKVMITIISLILLIFSMYKFKTENR